MLIPVTKYKDCEAALRFMTEVLGLAAHAVYRDNKGEIVHAQMQIGRGLMMFGPAGNGGFDDFLVSPGQAGGVTTTIYAMVADVAAAHDRAVEAGAEVVMPLAAQGYGGSSFSLRDPEGHIWSFGDYDPTAGPD